MSDIYRLDDKGLELADSAQGLAEQVAAPMAAEVDQSARYPEDAVAALREQGFLGLCVPEQYGGLGQPPRVFAAVAERLAIACPSTAMIYVMHVVAAQTFVASETLAARQDLLRDVAQGKHLTTLAFSERGSRSHFWAPVSKLRASGNGNGFVTTARKSWVTSANYADSYVSSGQMPDATSPLESTLYLVERAGPGVQVTDRFNGLGLRGNDSAPVEYCETPVAESRLLTAQGAGATMMLEVVLPWFCVGTAAMANGLCRAAIQATTQHLTTASLEHDGSKLRDFPTLRARVSEMNVRAEQSRALLAHTVDSMDQPNEQTPLYVLQARLAALEAAADVTDMAMKACGGAAFSRHLGVERIFRDARAGWVMAPTVDHLKEFVGRALTGLPLLS